MKFGRIFFLGSFLFLSFQILGQDLHFSQYAAAPLHLNPALTGNIDNGKTRVVANYRNQWSQILVQDAYKSYMVSIDRRKEKSTGNYFGWGISGARDISGALEFGTTQGNLSMSFGKLFTGRDSTAHYIVGGGQIGLAKRNVDPTAALWPGRLPWEPLVLPPTLEGFGIDFLYADVNVGLAWLSNFGNRKSFLLGIAAAHLNEPNISFFVNTTVPLSVRTTIHAAAEFPLNSKLSVAPNFLYLKQGEQVTVNTGSSLRYLLPQNDKANFIQAGLGFRTGNHMQGGGPLNSVITTAGFSLRNFNLGISYDLTVSKLRQAGTAAGAFEVALAYVIRGKRITEDLMEQAEELTF